MARPKRKILDPVPGTGVGPHKKHTGGSWWGIDQNHDAITTLIGKGAGEAVNFYGKIVDNPIAERVTNGLLMKGWRALLFTNRAGLTHRINSFGEKENIQGENRAGRLNTPFAYLDDGVLKSRRTEVGIKNLNAGDYGQYRNDNFPVPIVVGHKASELLSKANQEGLEVNYLDLTGKTSKWEANMNQVIIYNLVEQEQGLENPFVALQLRPQEIEAKPETSWASIKSMGRNLPMYHYLGGEDLLQFNINWFLRGGMENGKLFNPYYVINQCRKLKSWTYANGYISGPPVLYIQWGLSDIFAGEYWILTSATYNLGNFHDIAVVKKYEGFNNNLNIPLSSKEVDIINSGLIPYSATQELIFKRVSDHNLLSNEIGRIQQTQTSE